MNKQRINFKLSLVRPFEDLEDYETTNRDALVLGSMTQYVYGTLSTLGKLGINLSEDRLYRIKEPVQYLINKNHGLLCYFKNNHWLKKLAGYDWFVMIERV